jgi:predicted nucleic acid-binding protein
LPDFICNTSPLQYLHQLGRLEILSALTGHLIVPVPVIAELEAGRALGCDVPDVRSCPWVSPATRAAVLKLAGEI